LRSRKGFTLVELLVSLFIAALLISAVYLSFVAMLKLTQKETVSLEAKIEKAVGLEIMRVDVEHAGYGIATNSPDLPVEWNGTALTIRSVYNITRKETYKWGLVLHNGTGNCVQVAAKPETFEPSDYVIAVEPKGGSTQAVFNGTWNEFCSQNFTGTFLLFSYNGRVTSGCSSQFCNKFTYFLKESARKYVPEYCSTRLSLKRKVGNRSMPLIYCVGDFTVRFDWDNNSDGVIEPEEQNQNITITSSSASAEEVRKRLKLVRIYILTQEGGCDPKYVSPESFTVDNVTLSLPEPRDKLKHCRWRVLKLAVKPMNL